MQQLLQLYGSVTYIFKYYLKTKKYTWQEVTSSKYIKKEKLVEIVKKILKVSIPIALCALLSATTKTIDALTIVRILKKTIGEEEATIQYGILSGKIDTLVMLPFSFNIAFATALVPTISSSIAKKQIDVARRRIKLSILITILIGIPCSIILNVFSEQILKLLFPKACLGSQMLKYSAWSIIFVVLIQTINGALQGLGKVNTPVIAFGIGAVAKLIFNLIMIPNMQVKGAIFSTLIAHIISFIICFISLKKYIMIKFEISKFVLKPIIAYFLMYGISRFSYNKLNGVFPQNLSTLTAIIIAIIIYTISILVLKIISKEEIFLLPYGQKHYKRI